MDKDKRSVIVDLTPAAIVGRRKRSREIYAEFTRRFSRELGGIAVAERAAVARVKDIIWKGAVISRRPNRSGGIKYGDITITSGTVTAEILRYCGEGNYEVGERIKFPTRWLSLPDEAWEAELRVEVETVGRRKAEALEAEMMRREMEQERRERDQLAHLKAKYEPDDQGRG